jgi:hypothetical protein
LAIRYCVPNPIRDVHGRKFFRQTTGIFLRQFAPNTYPVYSGLYSKFKTVH